MILPNLVEIWSRCGILAKCGGKYGNSAPTTFRPHFDKILAILGKNKCFGPLGTLQTLFFGEKLVQTLIFRKKIDVVEMWSESGRNVVEMWSRWTLANFGQFPAAELRQSQKEASMFEQEADI